MEYTDFAGLTVVDQGESPWEDGGSFFIRNPRVVDRLLRRLKTHTHDGAAGLADPTVAPALATAATGGTLPSEMPLWAVLTLVDDQQGETLPTPAATITTPAGANQPGAGLTATADYTAGDLPANTYYYALTATDGAGGETPASDPVSVTLDSGHANGQVLLAGLLTAIAGAAGWRLYRSVNGGPYGFLAAGTTDAFTDDCSHCADTQLPPPADTDNLTSSTATLTVTIPALPTGAVAWRLYVATDPSFPSPSFVGEYTAAGDQTFASLGDLQSGQPPVVSSSIGGAAKLTSADLDIRWQDAVATAADLPTVGNTNGDVRQTLDDHALHVWDQTSAAWAAIGGGGGGSFDIDGNTVAGIDLYGGIGEDYTTNPGRAVLWVGWRNLSSNDFSYSGTLSDPNYIQQNVALDPGPFPLAGVTPDAWGALEAAAAGDDGRLAVLTGGAAASINSDSPQRSEARFFAAVADDKFGTAVKQLDIDNFIEGRVSNATGAPVLELVVVDAGVETVLASVPLGAAITSSCWLRTEINFGGDAGQVGVVGCSVYLVPPALEIAESVAHVAAMLDAAQNTKYGSGVVAGYGVRLEPAAGGNTLRATEWNGWRRY